MEPTFSMLRLRVKRVEAGSRPKPPTASARLRGAIDVMGLTFEPCSFGEFG
jgi:hypothetical protein